MKYKEYKYAFIEKLLNDDEWLRSKCACDLWTGTIHYRDTPSKKKHTGKKFLIIRPEVCESSYDRSTLWNVCERCLKIFNDAKFPSNYDACEVLIRVVVDGIAEPVVRTSFLRKDLRAIKKLGVKFFDSEEPIPGNFCTNYDLPPASSLN